MGKITDELWAKKICSICFEKLAKPRFKGELVGNNADPINDGRCCDKCNNSVVIVARIYGVQISKAMSVLGSATSEAKKVAARKNGKSGGRPVKK